VREVNDRIAAVPFIGRHGTVGFLCECSNAECVEQVKMTLAEYAKAKQGGPILAPGHSVY